MLWLTHMQGPRGAEQEHDYGISHACCLVSKAQLEGPPRVIIQAARRPLGGLQSAIGFFHLFELVVAVHLGNQDTAVIPYQEQVLVGNAGARYSRLGARLLVQHGQNLRKPEV